MIPLLILLSGCEGASEQTRKVDKTQLSALLEEFETIPKTLEQASTVDAYTLVCENANASQNDVNQAVAGLIALRTEIFETPMSFIDGALEPYVRVALEKETGEIITLGDCFGLDALSCAYDAESDGLRIRLTYDFRYFPNLKSLDLSGHAVEDLSGFAYLSALETLSLADNPAKSSNLAEETAVADVRSFDILEKLPLKSLDLSGRSVLPSLSILPKISTLLTLDLSENEMKDVSGIGDKFPSLQTLTMDGCTVTDPSSLSGLSNLKTLSMKQAKITDLAFLRSLGSLDSLVLDGVAVPDYTVFSEIRNLSSLSLSGCSITDVTWISAFTQLEKLNLSGNTISSCDFGTGKTSVRVLDLSANQILDFELGDSLALVEELNLSGNGLTSFAVNTSDGDCGLKVLNLSSNALSACSVGAATSLESLNLRQNVLSEFRLRSESLKSLVLSANPLATLELELPHLATLELACNTTYITPVILNTPSLKVLDLSQPFVAPADFVSLLTSLEILTIDMSLDTTQRITGLPELKTLSVSGAVDADLTAMQNLPKLESFSLSASAVEQPSLSGLESLKSLSISGCSSLANLSGIVALPALESLSVTGANLSAPSLGGLPKLRTLSLTACGITNLSGIANLPALESLSLSENLLESVSLTGFTALKYLDLSKNAIASRDAITLDIQSGSVDISGNKDELYVDLPVFAENVTVITKK